jgi:hypothetical protein
VFTEAERAALALTEEGTRIADTDKGVSRGTWSPMTGCSPSCCSTRRGS